MQFLDSIVIWSMGLVFVRVRGILFLRDTGSSQGLARVVISYYFWFRKLGRKNCFCFQDSPSRDLLLCSCLSQLLFILCLAGLKVLVFKWTRWWALFWVSMKHRPASSCLYWNHNIYTESYGYIWLSTEIQQPSSPHTNYLFLGWPLPSLWFFLGV